jgi:hypothetical protein
MSTFIFLSTEVIDEAEEELTRLLQRLPVRNAMMMDHGGYVFLSEGTFTLLPPQEMGAIVSGAYASLNTLAAMAAATQLTIRFHGSPMGSLMMVPLSHRILFSVSFDADRVDEEELRREVTGIVKRLKPRVEDDETKSVIDDAHRLPFSSIQFIEDRLNELFDGL